MQWRHHYWRKYHKSPCLKKASVVEGKWKLAANLVKQNNLQFKLKYKSMKPEMYHQVLHSLNFLVRTHKDLKADLQPSYFRKINFDFVNIINLQKTRKSGTNQYLWRKFPPGKTLSPNFFHQKVWLYLLHTLNKDCWTNVKRTIKKPLVWMLLLCNGFVAFNLFLTNF